MSEGDYLRSMTLRNRVDAPVTALAAGTSTERVLAAVGNTVVEGSTIPGLSASVVAFLPHGAVISALATSGAVVLVAAADTIFAVRSNCVTEPVRMLSCEGGRVLYMAYCSNTQCFIALTSLNVAYVIYEEQIRCIGDDNATLILAKRIRVVGPAVGIILAAGCFTDVASAGGSHPRCHVFSTGYSGNVVEWTFPIAAKPPSTQLTSSTQSTQVSQIRVHSPGCAVFAVKATLTFGIVDGNDCALHLVATCSDDRTAAVFLRRTSPFLDSADCERQTWMCLWRGSGANFARCRVFDVALHVCVSAADALQVWCAVGGEDGSVQVVSVGTSLQSHSGGASPLTSPTVEHIYHRGEQHGGHGTYKVAFARGPRDSGGGLCVVSGGYDGTAVCKPLRHQRDKRTFCYSIIPQTHGVKQSSHVRCIHVDSNGYTLSCTEAELHLSYFLTNTDAEIGCRSSRVLLSVMLEANNESPTFTKRGGAQLPSTLGSVVGKKGSWALVGTVSGLVLCVPYKTAMGFTLKGSNPTASVQKCLEKYGKCLSLYTVDYSSDTSVLVLSLHIGSSLVVSAFHTESGRFDVVYELDVGCPGITITATCAHYSPEDAQVYVFAGDKRGILRVFVIPRRKGGSCVEQMEPAHTAKVFPGGLPISVLHAMSRPPPPPAEGHLETTSSHLLLTVVAAEGKYMHLHLDSICSHTSSSSSSNGGGAVTNGGVSISPATTTTSYSPLCVSPLCFPFDVSTVLAATDRVWVTQLGTRVEVYGRIPGRHAWRLLAAYEGVKAPRLLGARVVALGNAVVMAVMSHCSDGHHMESNRFVLCSDSVSDACASVADSFVLCGGAIPGKDFNCGVYVPAPASCFLYGNEDSSMVTHPLISLTHREVDAAASPEYFCGPHHSNILALCTLPQLGNETNLVVTAGGLATLTVWEWSHEQLWRVRAYRSDLEATSFNSSSEFMKRMKSVEDLHGTTLPSVSAESVSRYMCVCSAGSLTMLVGGSDATLSAFSFDCLTGRLSCTSRTLLSSDCPKPIMTVNTLGNCNVSDSSVVVTEGDKKKTAVAGDTNGNVYVVDIATMRVLASTRLEQSSVNALSMGHAAPLPLRNLDSGNINSPTSRSWRVASIHDSGILHLVGISESEGSWSLVSLATYCCGITAGRAVHWAALGDPLMALCEERWVSLQVSVEAAVNDPCEETLQARAERRVNARCVSGMAVAKCKEEEEEGWYEVAIVGQGADVFRYNCHSQYV